MDAAMTGHAEASMDGVEDVMGNYIHSFQLFAHIMAREIEEHPDPDEIWDYLKKIDSRMFEIEGIHLTGFICITKDGTCTAGIHRIRSMRIRGMRPHHVRGIRTR